MITQFHHLNKYVHLRTAMLVFATFTYAHVFYLRSLYNGKYVGHAGTDITLLDKSRSDVFEIVPANHSDESLIVVHSHADSVWNVVHDSTRLAYSRHIHGHHSQHFIVIEQMDSSVMIVTANDGCVAYDEHLNYLVVRECNDEDDRQYFYLLYADEDEDEDEDDMVMVSKADLDAIKMAVSDNPPLKEMLASVL